MTSTILFVISLLVCNLYAQAPLPSTVISASELASNNTRLFNQFTNESDINKSYRAGLISKGEAMQASVLHENRKSMDIYGEIIDQHGNPIPGVNVTGSIAIRQGWYAEDKWEKYKTQSDANGLFHFAGLTGADWAVDVEKEGYEMDYNHAWIGSRGGPHGTLSSSNNTAILTMWKLKGAEPMAHSHIHAYIPCNGSVIKFDLLTGGKAPSGDLTVRLTRNPVDIIRGKPFNWSVSLEIPNGGFQEITNLYPNEAPAVGYISSIALDFPTNATGWLPSFEHAYYFQSRNGQVYGRISINIQADFQPPPTFFGADIYANPAGSRNLEFDYKKQIR